jgi:SNF2 family DNA or RNA helicase
MSVQAGSRGLNLQEASYVYHFDRTWNPMDELQAEDRLWRMGQQRKVFVYRFIQLGTIEERLHKVLARKHSQFLHYVDSMAEDTDPLAESQWTIEELIDLMQPSK